MTTPPPSPHPPLESIFACDDQSALLNNFVTSENPPPGAWSHHASPQSALGKVSFPLVLTIPHGELYTFQETGVIAEEMLDQQRWLPWSYDGANDRVSVERSIGPDLFHARIHYTQPSRGLLLLECVPASDVSLSLTCADRLARITWEDHFDIDLRFIGDGILINMSDDPAPIRRRFAGFADVPLNPSHLDWTWKHLRRCWIGVEFVGDLEVVFAVGRPGQVVSTGIAKEEIRRQERQRWQTFFDTLVPPLSSPDPVMRDAYYFAWQTLWSNRCTGGAGELPCPFTSPARLWYGAQWWWDEAFSAAIYRHLLDPSIAYEFLENFRLAQADDGMIPGCLSFTTDPPRTGPPPIGMQPPVIGCILQLLRERPGWPNDLRPLYTVLHQHALWHALPHRDTDSDGLSEYFHSDDSAVDQSQRWDAQKINPTDVVGPLHPTEAVDHNVWLSILWDVLGDMADALGDQDAAADHRERGKQIMVLVEQWMWDEADGFYYDIDARSHRKLTVRSPAAFMPMLSRHARPDRVARLVHEHLVNTAEFWCAWPVCSVSLDTPDFDPVNMFRGSTWVMFNWLVVEGLSRQGYAALAQDLARRTVEMVGPRYSDGKRTRSPRVWEWYHPHTGDPLGNSQYTWSALVIDLILRFLKP